MNQRTSMGLDDFLRIVDVATTIRKKSEEVERQLNQHEVKEELKERLRATARTTGETLSEEQIEAAISHYFQGLYSFKAPERNFEIRLAELYVDREKITKKIIIPTGLGLGAISASSLIIIGGKNLIESSRESRVERNVEDSYSNRVELERKVENTDNSPYFEELSQDNKDKLRSNDLLAKGYLNSTSRFFEAYCQEGKCEESITRINYSNVSSDLEVIKLTLDKASNLVAVNDSTLERQRMLIENRKESNELIEGIRVTSLERETTMMSEELYNQIEGLYISSDLEELSKVTGELRDINTRLTQVYNLRIVSRNGVKSGIDRYYTDENGKRSSGYYLIVEAATKNGEILNLPITNEEDGKTEIVSMWGERVPNDIYEKIKADKKDDGIIQDNTVGVKRRGYLEERITMEGVTKQGRITRW